MCILCAGAGRSAGLFYGSDSSAAAQRHLRAVSDPLTLADASGDRNIDALLWNTRWASNDLTFTFPKSAAYYPDDYPGAIFGPPEPDGFQAVTAKLAAAFRAALDQYEAIADLRFTEVGATRPADITAARTTASTPSASASPPGPTERAGDTWFNTTQFNAPVRGDYGWMGPLHEIGHALGLKHGHEEGYGIAGAATSSDRDSFEFSLMSYRAFVGAPVANLSVETFGHPQTLMMYDIAAIQHLYGANFKTNAGNTVYTVSPTTGELFVNGDGEGRPGGNRVFQTIWDGGGNDTYDFSAYAGDQTISLAAGGWSLLSETQRAQLGVGELARGNIFNALQHKGDARSLIENVIGGRGDDAIAGNQAANRLTGGIGNDTLSGSGGGDRLFGGTGADTLNGDAPPSSLRFGTGQRTLGVDAKNNSYATAIDLGTNFSLKADPNIAQSTEAPHTSVTAVGVGRPAYYKITLEAGATLVADIDDATGKFDDNFFSVLELRKADGTALVTADDVGGPLDPGSNYYTDAYIRYEVQESGTYYLYLGDYYNFQAVPDGAKYTLHISLPDPDGYLIGRAGADTLDGGTGADLMRGGLGNDSYIVDDARDRVIETARQGTDVVTSTVSYTLGAGQEVETLQLAPSTAAKALSLAGNAFANALIGNRGANALDGFGGADVLTGGAGADALNGGAGADRFVFRTLADSTAAAAGRDLIEDFLRAERDRIDLRLLDADDDANGNQAFDFVGKAAFSGDAGELRYAVLGGARFLYGDVDGDRANDFAVKIAAGGSLIEADFLL